MFDDLDICMDGHPADEIEASTQSSKALVDFRLKFFGDAAHASGDPWNGNSAVDAMELYTTALNYYREHIRPTARKLQPKIDQCFTTLRTCLNFICRMPIHTDI